MPRKTRAPQVLRQEPAPEVVDRNGDLEIEREIAGVHTMLERGDVNGARRRLQELRERWPESEPIARFARIIAPPTTQVLYGQKSRSMKREHAWLREHGHEHPDRWLAVYGDELIAEDTDFQRLLSKVRERIGNEGALLHRQGPARDRD